ncbi:MAG: TonB-dependent receptor, partial [Alphaproteobacteria bacterium]|nr:TonB-dependent receptor [Alphaproteobacteria bacterium]
GFNVPPGPNDPQMAVFPEEQTLAFEVGAKTRWLDGRLSADLALFYTDYDNFQNTIFLNGVNTVLSVDEVDVKGLEVALRGDLGGGFTTDLGFAYTESKIGPYIVPDPLGSGQMVDYTGNRTPNSPRFTLNVGGEYTAEIGQATLNIRLDYQHVGKLYYEVDNILHSPDHGWLNARISVAWQNFEVAVWAKNLTDERWAISAFGQTQLALLQGLGPGGPFDSFTINKGAQYGARIKARF